VDSNVEKKIGGGARSETKRLLMSKGMDAAGYGTLVHEVLRGKSPMVMLPMCHLDLGPKEFDDSVKGLERLYVQFMSNDLMKERKKDGKDLQELPFELREGDTLYMGVIDRLVQLNDGKWALIDYKTVSHSDDVHDVLNNFKDQMCIYGKAVKGLLKTDFDSYIYFTESGTLVRI